jgi:hypothetical protein
MAATVPQFSKLIAATTTSAAHLEMRDAYTPDDPGYLAWLAGSPVTAILKSPEHRAWHRLVREHLARGVRFRRARIVSEPLASFIRFEYEMTGLLNIDAGEQVRWLPRRRASDLCLPGNDFWVLDDRLVRFGHFAGDGTFTGHDMSEDPAVVRLCATALEAVWERANDHSQYRPAA